VKRVRAVLVAMALGLASARALAGQVPGGGGGVPLDTSYGCIVCHADHREGMILGVHAERGIRCADCHGGDPSARELPAGHRGRFVSGRDKVSTVQLCGSCHSDPNRMRQFGLPTGELAEFRTSRHGALLLGQHDTNAPTCTDCHGTHVIYPPDDARSKVYPSNIPGTCARCHADAQLMARYRIPTNQFEEFRRSAHGIALFQHQNFAAPTCVGCHGAHSALPPSVTEVAGVCGRCHQLVGQAFAIGPHGAAGRTGKLAGCLGCHTNHGTERVPVDRIVAVCDKCHASDARVHEMSVQIQKLVAGAASDLDAARRAVGQLALAGPRAGDYRFRYESALTYYLQIAQVQHSLDVPRIEDLSRRVRSISVELGSAAEALSERQWEHKLLLAPIWFLALSAVALAWLTWRTLRKAEAGRER
jgi:cytochrome c3-like protein